MKNLSQNISRINIRRLEICVFLLIISFICISVMATCSTQNKDSGKQAERVVTQYLDAKKNNDYGAWKSALWTRCGDDQSSPTLEKEGDLGVISLTIGKAEFSAKKTQQIKKQYAKSELAKSYGWTDEYIQENIIAVYAEYTVDYDNTKVPYNEGVEKEYFYLVRADSGSPWLVWTVSGDTNS